MRGFPCRATSMLCGLMASGDDRIRASVMCAARALDGGTKVRVTIFNGADFRTPTITRGAIFEDETAARHVADQCVEALEKLGIPIEADLPDGHEAAEPLLPPGPFESGSYRVVPA